MKGNGRRLQGIVAAGLLAVLTLSVFAASAYSGPESTVFRFHEAIADRSLDALKQTCLQDPGTPPTSHLVRDVQHLLVQGAQVQVGRADHDGRYATVDVVYGRKGLGVFGIRYFLQKPTNRWLVDGSATWEAAVRARMGGR